MEFILINIKPPATITWYNTWYKTQEHLDIANSDKAAALSPPGEWQYIVYKMHISQR